MIVCSYEDRPDHLVGLQLLVLCLRRHAAELALDLTCPQAPVWFKDWLGQFPGIRLRERPSWQGRGWNIKPGKLLELLGEGHPEVVWIDGDIILNGDFRPLLTNLTAEDLVVTEEVYWGQRQGGTERTESWGLPVGRALPCTVNSGLLRVTPRHVKLLEFWQHLMLQPRYLAAQDAPYYTRPLHMVGDQDVLTAVLGSKPFADVPVRFLKRGSQIIQNFGPAGYTLPERLRNLLCGLPPLIHAQGRKPWEYSELPDFRRSLRHYYEAVYLELSPYTHLARHYRASLDQSCPWMEVRTLPGRICAALARGEPTLAGAPQAAFDTAVRRLKQLLHLSRYRIAPATE